MSKITRKARAAAAKAGTIAADRSINVVDRPASPKGIHYEGDPAGFVSPVGAFSAQELETMPLTVVNTSRGRARVWRDSNGSWYRYGGHLRIQPQQDGQGSRFQILLLRGANQGDLDALLRVVERTRAGIAEEKWERRGQEWAAWADERTFVYRFLSRPYADPHTVIDSSPRVEACCEPRCRDRWHESEFGVHTLDEVRRKLGDRGCYQVKVSRTLDADAWTVDVYTDEFYGRPEDVASLVSDLQWMQEECRQANEAAAHLVAAS